MKFELEVFILMIVIGLALKKMDWRGNFYILLFVCAWVFYNWKKG